MTQLRPELARLAAELELDALWVYLTAPFVGGVVGMLAYALMRRTATVGQEG